MSGPDDDLERLYRLEYAPAKPEAAPAGSWASPRHSPSDVATESAPPGAAVAAQLARSRELHGGWRWTPEQKHLKAAVRAQRQIGAELDSLAHVGVRVMHARRASNSAQPVDHIVVGPRGVFVVADVVSTSDQPIAWQPPGHLAAAGVSMRLFEESLVNLARNGVGLAETMLGNQWRVPVEPIIAVAGTWRGPAGVTASGVMACDNAGLRTVIHGPVTPALFDATDVAVIASSVARAFPSAG